MVAAKNLVANSKQQLKRLPSISGVLLVAGWLYFLEYVKFYLEPVIGTAGTQYLSQRTVAVASACFLSLLVVRYARETVVVGVLLVWTAVPTLAHYSYGLVNQLCPVLVEPRYTAVEQYVLYLIAFHLILAAICRALLFFLKPRHQLSFHRLSALLAGGKEIGAAIVLVHIVGLFRVVPLVVKGSFLLLLSGVQSSLKSKNAYALIACLAVCTLINAFLHNASLTRFTNAGNFDTNAKIDGNTLNGSFSIPYSDCNSEFGLVQVIDQYEPIRVRFLRSGHSILGGVWPNFGGQSIFAAFYLADFVRFISRKDSAAKGAGARALFLGLGVGVGPKLLIEHNVSVHAVEIDKRVVDVAKVYFDFLNVSTVGEFAPESCNSSQIMVADARQLLQDVDQGKVTHFYDYIIHDVFSGGTVSSSLLEDSVFRTLKRLLRHNGVLVFNYVGRVNHPNTLYFFKTLKKFFTNIRAFHDQQVAVKSDVLQNIVFFCADFGIKFKLQKANLRKLNPKDPRYLYELTKQKFKEWEIDFGAVYTQDQLIAPREPLSSLAHYEYLLAFEHWSIMRQVIPAAVWNTYSC